MKTLICALILATLGSVAAKADDITIAFDQPNQTGAPGATLQYFGTITNNTNATIFLNADALNLPSGFALNDLFFSNVPVTLAPNATSADIEFFEVTLNDPFLNAITAYSENYGIFGGADGNAQDFLGSADFSVTPAPGTSAVPEPSSIFLMLSGFSTLIPIAKKMRSQTA
jgi:hypothetical protein